MKLSRELMIKNNMLKTCIKIAIVTSSFHMRRSIMIAERVFRDDGVNIVSCLVKIILQEEQPGLRMKKDELER